MAGFVSQPYFAGRDEEIKELTRDGDDFLVTGFGKFCVKEKCQRRGRNRAIGNELVLPRVRW